MQSKNISSGFIAIMCAGMITTTPVQAIEGVDNLTIAQRGGRGNSDQW